MVKKDISMPFLFEPVGWKCHQVVLQQRWEQLQEPFPAIPRHPCCSLLSCHLCCFHHPVTSAVSIIFWVRGDRVGTAAAVPSPSTVLHTLPCNTATEHPFLSPLITNTRTSKEHNVFCYNKVPCLSGRGICREFTNAKATGINVTLIFSSCHPHCTCRDET